MRRRCLSILCLLGVLSALWTTPLEAASGYFYQTISNTTQPDSVDPNTTYFLTAFVMATDSAKVNGDLVIQVREWGGATGLATHTLYVPATFMKRELGRWVRIGAGITPDLFRFVSPADDSPDRSTNLFKFVSSADASLDHFTIEFGFGAGAVYEDALMLDGVQLEKALILPSGNVAAYPTPWVAEKGIVSPSDAIDVKGASHYYMW